MPWGPRFYLRIQSSGLVVWLPLSCNWYQRHLHCIISFTPMTQPPTRVLVSACPSAQHPHQQVLSTQLRRVYRNSGIPGSHSPPEAARESLLSSKHDTLHCTLLLQLPLRWGRLARQFFSLGSKTRMGHKLSSQFFGFALNLLSPWTQNFSSLRWGEGWGEGMSRLNCLNSASSAHIPLHLEETSFISPLSLKGISPTKRHSPYSVTWSRDRRKGQQRKTNLLTKDSSAGIPEILPLLNM